jgi:hypothetical protein
VALEEVVFVPEFDKLDHARTGRIVDWTGDVGPINPEVHVAEGNVTHFGDPYRNVIAKVNILWKLETGHLV